MRKQRRLPTRDARVPTHGARSCLRMDLNFRSSQIMRDICTIKTEQCTTL